MRRSSRCLRALWFSVFGTVVLFTAATCTINVKNAETDGGTVTGGDTDASTPTTGCDPGTMKFDYTGTADYDGQPSTMTLNFAGNAVTGTLHKDGVCSGNNIRLQRVDVTLNAVFAGSTWESDGAVLQGTWAGGDFDCDGKLMDGYPQAGAITITVTGNQVTVNRNVQGMSYTFGRTNKTYTPTCTADASAGSDVSVPVPPPDIKDQKISGTGVETVAPDGIAFNLSVTPLDENGKMITQGEKSNFKYQDVIVSTKDTAKTQYCTGTAEVTKVEVKPGQTTATGKLAGVVLLDSSGSMASNDPGRTRVSAAQLLIKNLVKSGAAVSVCDFGVGGGFRKLADFGATETELIAATEQIQQGGDTPMYEGIQQSITNLAARTETTKDIFVLTDGNANNNTLFDDTVKKANAVPIAIFTISLGKDVAFKELQDLASKTNGSYIEAEKANDLVDRFEAQGVAATQGRVTVFGTGKFDKPLAIGVYELAGNLVTTLGKTSAKTPFSFTFTYAGDAGN